MAIQIKCFGEMMDVSIVLHGGLGNQLFQWAFGHSDFNPDPKISFIHFEPSRGGLDHTKESMRNLYIPCTHGTFKDIKKKSFEMVDFEIKKRINQRFPNAYRDTYFDYTPTPFDVPTNLDHSPKRKKITYMGYFQNYDLIFRNQETLASEVWSALDARELSQLEVGLQDEEIVHIRGATLEGKEYLKTHGVLDRVFLETIFQVNSVPKVIVTNEPNYASMVSQGLNVSAIIGPNQLDSIQTLSVMARSKKLYCANSTLSWWGGFLCQFRGGDVYIPSPFYKNYTPNPCEAYNFPGFRKIQSTFN